MVEMTDSELDMGDLAKFNQPGQITPRRFWSSSMDSNSA
jgi:hypothetical protein